MERAFQPHHENETPQGLSFLSKYNVPVRVPVPFPDF